MPTGLLERTAIHASRQEGKGEHLRELDLEQIHGRKVMDNPRE